LNQKHLGDGANLFTSQLAVMGLEKPLTEMVAACGSQNDQQTASSAAAMPAPRKLRVLVFTLVFPNPNRPLHGTFVLERIRHLAAFADVEVVAPVAWFRAGGRAPGTAVAPILSVSHPRFWYIPKLLMSLRGLSLFLSTVRGIVRLRRSFDFDLIDAHFAYPDGFAAVLLGRWFRRPVCITLRGTIVPISRHRVGSWLCNWAIRRAERLIAVSHNLADRAREGGVADHRIATIANGVDGSRFHPLDRRSARRAIGLPEEGELLVSVGHISPRKGFHRVIRALPHLLAARPEARLAIVGGKGGEEDNSAELRKLVREFGIADRVLFAGAQPPDRVALWMGAADVFVLASDFEGCPNVILEAMACGRPVVATKVGDIERMVPSFAGILLDDPEDAVALAASLAAALTRDWDTQCIHDHVATQSWTEVAQLVAAQWRLAVDAFRTEPAGGSAVGAEELVTAVVRSRGARDHNS
jgi:teichuronic acid biosynthesis glycosyltransferase TuaC